MINNIFIIYNILHPDHKISNKNFRIQLVRELVERYSQNKHQDEANIQNMPSLPFKYIPVAITCTPNNKYPTKRCVVCYEKDIRKYKTYVKNAKLRCAQKVHVLKFIIHYSKFSFKQKILKIIFVF